MERKTEAFIVYVMRGKGNYPSIRVMKLKEDFPERRKLGIDQTDKAVECWVDTLGRVLVDKSNIIKDYFFKIGR